MATNTYVALKTTTVGTAVPSVTLDLTGITGYTDLILVCSLKSVGSASNSWVRFGNSSIDTGANYSWTRILGNGSTATSARGSNTSDGVLLGDVYTTNFTADIIQIQNYSNTTTNKTALTRNNFAANLVHASVGLWRSTSAINYVQVYASGVNLDVGSTFTIYGIAAASVGAKATGGTIYQDSTHFYHVFAGNGTFTPTQSITADCLVVAGGGGGGFNRGGGGGAGGLLAHTSQSLTATNYSITVGGGGAGSGSTVGANGGNSQFASLTASVGGGGGASGAAATNAGNGGSGGGGVGFSGDRSGGTGTSGQGFAGGLGKDAAPNYGAGGGGGAGAVGANGTSTVAGNGGVGVSTYSSWGVATGIGQLVSGTYFLAGGGGGAANLGASAGTGGNGGGGNAGTTTVGANGISYTGGGGGGGGYSGSSLASGNGGSGVVIVRYAK